MGVILGNRILEIKTSFSKETACLIQVLERRKHSLINQEIERRLLRGGLADLQIVSKTRILTNRVIKVVAQVLETKQTQTRQIITRISHQVTPKTSSVNL